ncbi:GGDEF domain-containing protein [Devosia rhizoryzae]|uniref:diguanylate cyclase n=1 Tax=Devosia rhizoryzae TaxID=2774137 RepID=A0ABX7C1M3_9HYPH|nr:GGDEF domain-containing protein [Devosia rhizoryzae]QQR38131.1 GGDEF domain-containing protein [Devosia rhizoryzae]
MDNFAFLLPVTMALFGVTFLIVGATGQRVAFAWGLAFAFGAIGFTAPILPLPIKLQSLLANAVFLVSFFYYGEALLTHFRAPRLVTVRIVFALLVYAAIIVAVEGFESLPMELTIADLASAVLLGVPVCLVFWRAQTLAERALVAVATVVVVDIVARLFIFSVLVGLSPALADFAGSTYTFYMQASVGVLSVSFALAAMASVVDRMLAGYRDAAERDPLTGLLNRRGFDVAAALLSPADRQRGVVMTCDIDHFKTVNDSFGHAAGDAVLSGLADLLVSRMPAGSLVARFGGEEFVVLLRDVPLASSGALAQSIRADFSARDWRPAGVDRQITLCIGLAGVNPEDASLHDALARADRALYSAKANGRNRVMIDAGESYVASLRVVPATSAR